MAKREDNEELLTISVRALDPDTDNGKLEIELAALTTLSRNENSRVLRLQDVYEFN